MDNTAIDKIFCPLEQQMQELSASIESTTSAVNQMCEAINHEVNRLKERY